MSGKHSRSQAGSEMDDMPGRHGRSQAGSQQAHAPASPYARPVEGASIGNGAGAHRASHGAGGSSQHRSSNGETPYSRANYGNAQSRSNASQMPRGNVGQPPRGAYQASRGNVAQAYGSNSGYVPAGQTRGNGRASNNGGGGKKGGGKSNVWRVVFWVALAVCIASVVALGVIFWSYWAASNTYNKIADQAFPVEEETTTSLADMTVDWDYLKSVNPDIVAWIYIPGTNVNYPVVQTTNNEKYLNTDFNGDSGLSARSGTIFLDMNDSAQFADTNNVMYGHHMNDGSMFACLSTQMTDQTEFNAHRTVYVLTPRMNYECQSFSLVLTDGYDAIVETTFANDASRTAYVQDKEDRSVVQPSEGMPVASSVTKMFTLSTCDYTRDNGRAVMFTRMVNSAIPNSMNSAMVDPSDVAQVESAAKEAA